MKISYTSYTMFLANWEKFRLYKGLGYVPEVPSMSLQRGLGLHLLAEHYHKGDSVNLTERCAEDGISPEGLQAARLLWPTLRDYLEMQADQQGTRVVVAEADFEIPLPDSPHFITGRLDAIVETPAGFIVDEYKSAGPRKKMWEIEKEWRCNPQANFVLLGARHLGYDVSTVNVVTVQEGTPPVVLPHMVSRGAYDLEYQVRSCIQVCDVIEFLVEKYGLDQPWPHTIHTKWASDIYGSCNNDWCEYKEICGSAVHGQPDGFLTRPEDKRL